MASLALGLGGSLLSGVFGGKGAKKAAQTQAQALQRAMDQQNQQFQQTRADNMPFLQAGQGALQSMAELLGLQLPGPISGFGGGTFNIDGTQATPVGVNDAQEAAIARLKASPGFTSLFNTGADTILQNAAATGGLRGGNTQNSLAQFGSGLLASTIERQLANLGGIANIGAGTAGNLGSLGQSNANSISQLLADQGNARAGGILGGSTILNKSLNDVIGQIQTFGRNDGFGVGTAKKWGW